MSKGYYTITEITDYGPFVTKIILPMPSPVKARHIKAKSFSVYAERLDENGEVLSIPKSWMALDDLEESKGYIPVQNAYPSDLKGQKQKEGSAVTLEMKYGPDCMLSSAICAPKDLNIFIHNWYTITQTADIPAKNGKISGLVFDQKLGNSMPAADGFLNSTSSYKEEPLNYGYYIPQTAGEKKPLIIWLHGAGEGGTDPTIAYTANKVVALISPKIQSYFGGAYVFVPQTKTFWMNDGTGTYGTTGTTIYGTALKAAIDEFIEKNPGIDTDRIYIGGDSNGGFMTMRMIIDYPEFFAAAFPVCEALFDHTISDQDIENIRHLPVWFTHAKNDPVVNPAETVVPTYLRLQKAGAKHVHFTFWDKIEDLHEGFVTKEGQPFEYLGHFAWVPVLNDDCRLDYDEKPVLIDGQEVTLFKWLSLQKKQA